MSTMEHIVIFSQCTAASAFIWLSIREFRRRRDLLHQSPLVWFIPLLFGLVAWRALTGTVVLITHEEARIANPYILVPNVSIALLIFVYLAVRSYYALVHDNNEYGVHDFFDEREEVKHALQLQDIVLQDLIAARWALSIGHEAKALEHLDKAATSVQKIVNHKIKRAGGRAGLRLRPEARGT